MNLSPRAPKGWRPSRRCDDVGYVGDFRKLRAWQEAKRFALLSRRAIAALPSNERFALAAQWRRASYSVALNLAEGASRVGDGNFRRHVDIARGSLDGWRPFSSSLKPSAAWLMGTFENCGRAVRIAPEWYLDCFGGSGEIGIVVRRVTCDVQRL